MARRIRSLLVVSLFGLALHVSAVGADAPCIADTQGVCAPQVEETTTFSAAGVAQLTLVLAAPAPGGAQSVAICMQPSADLAPCLLP